MAFANALPLDHVALPASHRLGDGLADPASRQLGGIVPRGEETDGGNAACCVIHGALTGTALRGGLLML